MLRMTFEPNMKAGEDLMKYGQRSSGEMSTKWRIVKIPTMTEKVAEKVQSSVGGRPLDGGTGVGEMGMDPTSVSRWKQQQGIHNRCVT